MENIELNWSNYKIAKNLNYYREAFPDETFWELWKADKDTLKSQGFSVYKNDNGDFKVYDWSRKDKAPQEEYDKQEAIKEQKAAIWQKVVDEHELENYRATILLYVEDQCDDRRVKRRLLREIESATSTDEMHDILSGEAVNIDCMWSIITTDVYSDIESYYKTALKEANLI
jgi:hypothetical protein